MPVIKQTTTHDCSINDFFDQLLRPQESLRVDSSKPSLWFCSAEGALGQGEKIIYTLQYGIFQIRWTTEITSFVSNKYLEHQLTKGPLRQFVHRQGFEAHGHKTIVHDEIEFLADADLEPILENMLIVYPQREEAVVRERKSTEKIKAIRKNAA